MSELVDITMTATIRPDIVEKTLRSFTSNLFYNNPERFRLVINIDPIGDDSKSFKDVLLVCKKFFNKRSIIVITPSKPSFPQAVLNVWNNSTYPWIFHLEDDWVLNKQLNIDNMIEILTENKKLACLRLCKHSIPNTKTPVIFKSKYSYYKKGFLVAADKRRQFGLNPVLLKREFLTEALPKMVSTSNPEKQFRYSNGEMRDILMKWEYGIYGKPGTGATVRDIGRVWTNGHKYQKPSKGQFLTWEKK